MNTRYLLSLLLLLFFGRLAFSQSGKFIVTNTSGVSRLEEPVVVSRQALEGFVSIPGAGKVAVLSIHGKEIPSQLDDLNQDGQWDELAFQIDIERNSTAEVKIKWVEFADAPKFTKRTQAWFGVEANGDGRFKPVLKELRPDDWTPGKQPARYQLEGPVWENDKVGFRNFFDSRNGIDIFGKTRPNIVLDSVDVFYRHYHKMCPWGMNLIKIGSSLGAGGFALIEKGELIQLQKTESAQYIQVANGPVRSMFDLIYEGWQVSESARYNVKLRISIWAGKFWYKNEITVSGFIGDKEIAVGIVNIKNPSQAIYKTNNMAYTSLCTHARQTENNDLLGMGLLFSSRVFGGYGEAPRGDIWPKTDTVSHTYYAKLKIRSGQAVDYYFFAGWEKTEAKFGNTKYFTDVVQEEADRREFPLQVGKK